MRPNFEPGPNLKLLVFLSIKLGLPVSAPTLMEEPEEVIKTYLICLEEIAEAEK